MTRPCGAVSHARMGGTRRPPRCRGGRPVLSRPIDRRLRRCVLAGTQHLFVVVRRHSCVMSGVWRRRCCCGRRREASWRGACAAPCGVRAAAVLWLRLRLRLRRRLRSDSRGAWRAGPAWCERGGGGGVRARRARGARSSILESERWAVQVRHAAITARHHRTSTVAFSSGFSGCWRALAKGASWAVL